MDPYTLNPYGTLKRALKGSLKEPSLGTWTLKAIGTWSLGGWKSGTHAKATGRTLTCEDSGLGFRVISPHAQLSHTYNPKP